MIKEPILSKLPSGYIPFSSTEQFLVPSESKILRRRLVERFVPWEDESSFNHVKVKSKGKKSGKENVASDAAPNENVNVKRILVMLEETTLILNLQKE